MREPVSARITGKLVNAAKRKAEREGVTVSAILESALSSYLDIPIDELSPEIRKPEWAIALEERVSQLEQSQRGGGRKGKRRR